MAGGPAPPRPGRAPGPSRAVRRQRTLVVGAVMMTALGVSYAGCGMSRHRSAPPASSRGPAAPSSRPATTAATAPATTAVPAPVRGLPTTVTTMTFSEAAGPSGPGRVLPTSVRVPAPGSPGTRGPWPLIVFSEGFEMPPEAYATLLDDWASAGYVVAAPTYPHTSSAGHDSIDESDIVHHPADLSFVIGQLLTASAGPGSPLSGLIEPGEVAVAGHSDGGLVSLAVAANTCCRDTRVRAAAILSGSELSSLGGAYYRQGSPPMLVTQGSDDTINPPVCSVQIYDAAPAPKYYLDLVGASHKGPYLSPGPDRDAVAAVTTDFFDFYLKQDARAPAAMGRDGSVPGVAAFSTAPSVGSPNGYCPGA